MIMATVEEQMESCRTLSNGTMPINVLFDTEEEVKQAKAWMKGKRKVKTLFPMTKAESEKRHIEARAAIAKKLGIEE